MQKAIPIGDVIDVNKTLQEKGVAAKVHLHDACGAQTLSLEAFDGQEATYAAARNVVREFFDGRGRTIEFDRIEGRTFWAER